MNLIYNQLPTKNTINEQIMEVHKHPHHITHKKKWGMRQTCCKKQY